MFSFCVFCKKSLIINRLEATVDVLSVLLCRGAHKVYYVKLWIVFFLLINNDLEGSACG